MANTQTIPNLPYIRAIPKIGARLAETITALQKQIANIGQQTNATPWAQETPAPQPPDAISVNASGGVAHVQITDSGPIYRGTTYHVQYSATPGFESPVNHFMGPSRDVRIPVGTTPLYYRVIKDTPVSGHSAPVYHGGPTPIPVAASGTDQPAIPSGQGSGTGLPGQISGFGPIPYRGTSPPRRA